MHIHAYIHICIHAWLGLFFFKGKFLLLNWYISFLYWSKLPFKCLQSLFMWHIGDQTTLSQNARIFFKITANEFVSSRVSWSFCSWMKSCLSVLFTAAHVSVGATAIRGTHAVRWETAHLKMLPAASTRWLGTMWRRIFTPVNSATCHLLKRHTN